VSFVVDEFSNHEGTRRNLRRNLLHQSRGIAVIPWVALRTLPRLYDPIRIPPVTEVFFRCFSKLRKWNKNHKELAVASELCDISRMTRSRILLLITGLILASSATSFAQDKSDAATVRALELKWTESYKQRSIDILSSLLADEFVITVEDGNVYSKAGYISHTADSKVRVEVAELSDLKVRIHGNTAIVTGAYHEKGVSEGKPYEYHDRLTDVWIKSAGKWQVIASHYGVPYKE
jgi:ketosteroid isomerase-like protein